MTRSHDPKLRSRNPTAGDLTLNITVGALKVSFWVTLAYLCLEKARRNL